MKLDWINLAGFPLGGRIAVEFAIEHGHRVRKLVLVAPAGLRVPNHPTADIFRIRPDELPSELVVNMNVLLSHLPKEPDVDFLAARYREMTSLARVA
ncbi:MAG: hypothetical protein ACREQN_06685 [Candidatus Binataceae bacterium]